MERIAPKLPVVFASTGGVSASQAKGLGLATNQRKAKQTTPNPTTSRPRPHCNHVS